jgi:hypothetical protein
MTEISDRVWNLLQAPLDTDYGLDCQVVDMKD